MDKNKNAKFFLIFVFKFTNTHRGERKWKYTSTHIDTDRQTNRLSKICVDERKSMKEIGWEKERDEMEEKIE